MAKLNKKEKEKIEKQYAHSPERGDTWIGLRPVVMDNKKYDKKSRRRKNKEFCKKWEEGDQYVKIA